MQVSSRLGRFILFIGLAGFVSLSGYVTAETADPSLPESDLVQMRIRGFRNVKITRVEFQSVATFDVPGTGYDIKKTFRLPKAVRENQRFTLQLTMRDGDRLVIPAQLKKTYSHKSPIDEAGGGIYTPWVIVKLVPRGETYIWDVQVWGIR